MKSICIISQRYPCEATPALHVFVQKLAWALADHGLKVYIISPVPFYDRSFRTIREFYEETSPEGNILSIYRPKFVYLGEKKIASLYLSHFSADMMFKAACQVVEKYNLKPDVFYGHFICVAGICACRLGERYNKPAYIAYGESTDWSVRNFGVERIKRETRMISGFVAVSTKNRKRLVELGIADKDNSKVFVNGFNEKIFYPRDKNLARKKYGIPKDAFVISFVGQFSDRKGILRLNKAVEEMESDVKVIYAGKGKIIPEGSHVLYAGLINPEDIPEFLSASDIFVLPTQDEGCSNAILEAIGCGLPVISSDREFNYDILSAENAILINSNSVEEIRQAIKILKDNEKLRCDMAEASLKKRENFTINKRAEKIIEWMEIRNKAYYER